ncbi:MAG: ABC-type transport auxiliary lipoprotein family protein [Victivallaceae bacterium]
MPPKHIALILTVALTMVVSLSGCLFPQEPYKEVKYYDLQSPKITLPSDISVRIALFKAMESAKYKMVYRDAECQVLVDEYNKWIQPPEFLITRYLEAAFSHEASSLDKKTEFSISGTLYMFSLDLKDKTAALGVNYEIRRSVMGSEILLVKNSIVFRSQVKDENAAAFAMAMSQSAKKLAEALREELIQLKKTLDKPAETKPVDIKK